MPRPTMSAIVALCATAGGHAHAADVERSRFGTMPDGTAVEAVTLTNGHGVSARIITFGAIVQALSWLGKDGRAADVVLGYDTLDGYLTNPNYFGATVGRYANRIAGGRFTLAGHAYSLPTNNGPNTLHGGPVGLSKYNWAITDMKAGAVAGVTLRVVSPDGDQGFPGMLTVTATYTLSDRDELSVDYRATTDAPTIVNIINHSYFNLAGEGSADGAMGHLLTLPADAYTPVSATLIPTGEIRPVAGTAFDFRTAKPVARDVRAGGDQQLVFGRGFDHNFVIGMAPVAEPRRVARLEDPVSGRSLEVLSTAPGVQVYSGNFLDGTTVGKGGHIYRQGDAVALEPQLFPDTPNQPAFGSARLDPGQEYRHVIVYRLGSGAAVAPN